MAFDPARADDFTGSDGSIDERVSSSGARWEAPYWGAGTPGYTALQIASNALTTSGVDTKRNGVLDSLTFGPDIQMAVTITQLASGSTATLIAFSGGYTSFPATYGAGDLYWLEIQPGGGGAPGAYVMHRDIGASGVELIATTNFPGANFAAPESIGLSLTEEPGGTRILIWRKVSGVWTNVGTYLDTAAPRPGGQRYLGLELVHGSTALVADEFMAQTTASHGSSAFMGFLSRGAG